MLSLKGSVEYLGGIIISVEDVSIAMIKGETGSRVMRENPAHYLLMNMNMEIHRAKKIQDSVSVWS